jgi:O-antigen/teichoic acid export membrane protein
MRMGGERVRLRWRRCCSPLHRLSRRPLALGLLTSAAVQALGALTGVLTARALGPHDRGLLAAALLWPQLLILLGGLGIAEAVTVHLARAPWPDRDGLPGDGRAAVLGAALAITAAQAGALLALGLALVPLVGGRLLPDAAALTVPALALIPVYLVTLALMAALAGLRRFAVFHALRLLIGGGYALALVALALGGGLTPLTAMLAYIGAHLLAGLVAACTVRPGFPAAGWRGAARPLLSYGLRSHVGTLGAAVCERADQVAVAALLPPARLGAYLAAVSLSAPVGLVGAAAAVTALPVVAGARHGETQAATIRRYVYRSAVSALLLALPLAIGAPWLVEWWFGPAFREAVAPARILAFAAGVWGVGRVLGAVLRAVEAPGAAARCDLLAAMGVVGGLPVLVPHLGISGAAAAVALGALVGAVAAVRSVVRVLGLAPWGSQGPLAEPALTPGPPPARGGGVADPRPPGKAAPPRYAGGRAGWGEGFTRAGGDDR